MKKNLTSNINLFSNRLSKKKNVENSLKLKFEKSTKIKNNNSTNIKDELTKNELFLISNIKDKEIFTKDFKNTNNTVTSRKRIGEFRKNENNIANGTPKLKINMRNKVLHDQEKVSSSSLLINMTSSYSTMAKKLKLKKKNSITELDSKINNKKATDNLSSINQISKTTVSVKNSQNNTENPKSNRSHTNCYSNLDFESPEELHYFYVTMSQKNKFFAYKFEGEKFVSVGTIKEEINHNLIQEFLDNMEI